MASFEDSLTKLKEIIEQLETGNLTLEESIKLFEQGTKLISTSHKKLSEIEKKIQILTENKDGQDVVQDFEPEDEDS